MAFLAGALGAGACFGGVCLGGVAGAGFAKLLMPEVSSRDASRRSDAPRRRRPRSRVPDDSYSEEEGPMPRQVSQPDSKERQLLERRAYSKAGPHVFEDDENDNMIGFSMADARSHANTKQQQAMARSPADVLADLQKGNARFWMGRATRPEKSAFERRALISKQFPCVAVLGCSDSRVPVEIVFDMGLGDIFVIRVAGNCLDIATTASLQYAVKHLGVKVVIVMGHEGCGAVKAAGQPREAFAGEPEQLNKLLGHLKDNLDDDRLSCITDPRAHDREAVITNVKEQLFALSTDDLIMEKVKTKQIMCVGAFYEISSGIVDFFFELTNTTQSPSRQVLRRGMSQGVQSCLNAAPEPTRGTSRGSLNGD